MGYNPVVFQVYNSSKLFYYTLEYLMKQIGNSWILLDITVKINSGESQTQVPHWHVQISLKETDCFINLFCEKINRLVYW